MMQKLDFDMYINDNQVVRDAYDIIIANLHRSKEGQLPKTICIAGCAPKVGATTVAINLAISLAIAGWKTVFVDTDLRKPSEAKRLSQNSLKGLSDFLAGRLLLDDVLCQTNIDNLHYITCGDTNSINPIGLLCSNRFSEFLELIAAEYDAVIFDTPCLNSVGDTQVVASRTECTLVVALAGTTRRAELQQSMRKLDENGGKVAGVILNRMKKDAYKSHLGAYNYFTKDVDIVAKKQKRQVDSKGEYLVSS